MRFVKGFGAFWYDFLIGDDWKIAAAVAVVLGAGATIVATADYNEGVLTAVLAVCVAVTFTVTILLDVRQSRK